MYIYIYIYKLWNPVFVWVYQQKGTSLQKHPQLSKKGFYSPVFEIKPKKIVNRYKITNPSHVLLRQPWHMLIQWHGSLSPVEQVQYILNVGNIVP